VRDDEGATAASEPVFIEIANLPPRAVAEASPKTVDEDAVADFTARASTDTPSDMPSLTYHWEFGDGDDDDGMNVSHAYTRSGSYAVKLQVVDNDGAFSEDSSIKMKVRNVPPTVLASADRTAGKTGEQFSFRANGTDTRTDMPQLAYTWYFGDGAKAVGKAATHGYTAAGKYAVRVEVTDPEGEKAEAQLSIEVTQTKGQAPPPPGGPNYMLIGAAVAGAVAVAGVVILLMTRRKKGGPRVTSPPPPEKGNDIPPV